MIQRSNVARWIFFKLSAPYRGLRDMRRHLDRLERLLPAHRFVWGSDWLHIRFEEVATCEGCLAY